MFPPHCLISFFTTNDNYEHMFVGLRADCLDGNVIFVFGGGGGGGRLILRYISLEANLERVLPAANTMSEFG